MAKINRAAVVIATGAFTACRLILYTILFIPYVAAEEWGDSGICIFFFLLNTIFTSVVQIVYAIDRGLTAAKWNYITYAITASIDVIQVIIWLCLLLKADKDYLKDNPPPAITTQESTEILTHWIIAFIVITIPLKAFSTWNLIMYYNDKKDNS